MKGGKKIYKSFALAIIHAPFINGSYYNEMNPSLIMIVVIEEKALVIMEFLNNFFLEPKCAYVPVASTNTCYYSEN